MDQAPLAQTRLSKMLAERLVRYEDLQPCTTAFIDTRTPGRQAKENFTIIGPGVAESPDQHVHINIPHGFNIGGARQPPGCINSQHSHETAEVFVIHKGTWAFYLGPECEDGEVVLGPGDTISIPIHVFRGFKNVGDDVGYMFAVLGGDNPGNVTWAPYVFDSAREYGLILLEDGSLVDTTKGETIPKDKKAMAATTAEDVTNLRRLTADEMADCVVPHSNLQPVADAEIVLAGLNEYPIIGAASAGEHLDAGQMAWPHGFHLRHIAVDPGTSTKQHAREEEEVILVQDGQLTVHLTDGDVTIGPGDVFTIPIGMPRAFSNQGSELTEAYIVRGGDNPQPPRLID
jgi:mannose-6-phosphate isomerase-like protein (cupin superfamily)